MAQLEAGMGGVITSEQVSYGISEGLQHRLARILFQNSYLWHLPPGIHLRSSSQKCGSTTSHAAWALTSEIKQDTLPQ